MHSGQANSSLRGARRSAPCEMTVPISLPHCLHCMFNGTNTAHPPSYEPFGNSARTSGPLADKLACSIPTTWAPSPTAAATRFVEPERTSPIAKTPGRLVSKSRRSSLVSEPVTTKPFRSRAIPDPGSQSVLGSAPMKRKTCRIGRITSPPDKTCRHRTALSTPSRPSKPVTTAFVSTSTLRRPLIRSTRYCDMLDARPAPRTNSHTFST
jgi:hypothetical protein